MFQFERQPTTAQTGEETLDKGPERQQQLQAYGVRFIATSQTIDTDESNPTSRFLIHILMAAAEFERELIVERSQAGLIRYRQEYDAGRVGKETRSRSGKNLPVGRPKRVFDRERVIDLRRGGLSYREIASRLGLGEGTVRRVFQSPTGLTETRQKPVEAIL